MSHGKGLGKDLFSNVTLTLREESVEELRAVTAKPPVRVDHRTQGFMHDSLSVRSNPVSQWTLAFEDPEQVL